MTGATANNNSGSSDNSTAAGSGSGSGSGDSSTDGDEWKPPNLEDLAESYSQLHEKRLRIMLSILAGLTVAVSFRLSAASYKQREELAARDKQIAFLKGRTDSSAVADRVLSIIDDAQAAKQE